VIAFFTTIIVKPAFAADVESAGNSVSRRDIPHREVAFLPIIAFSSDTGMQLGAMGQMARFEPNRRPYAYRLQMQLAASIKDGPNGLEAPFHDDYLRFDFPGYPHAGQRLALKLGFQRYVGLGYYGFGNESKVDIPVPDPSSGRYTSYPSSIFTLESALQQNLGVPYVRGVVRLATGLRRTGVYSESLLAKDIAQKSIEGLGTESTISFGVGVVLDTRDHETFPTRGMFHDVFASGTYLASDLRGFARITTTTRFYWAPAGKYLVIAVRALADVLAGQAPFTQEASYGGLNGAYGPGGPNAVRGIAVGRFIGKTKAIGNVEVRSLPINIAISDQYFELGGALFVDAGRVWSGTLKGNTSADGTDLGIHVGVGGGPRIRWGDSFLLRFDLAYAPNAGISGRDGTTGFYVTGDVPF
jgi:hypothetical protein